MSSSQRVSTSVILVVCMKAKAKRNGESSMLEVADKKSFTLQDEVHNDDMLSYCVVLSL